MIFNYDINLLYQLVIDKFIVYGAKIFLVLFIAFALTKFLNVFLRKILELHLKSNDDYRYEKRMRTAFSISRSTLRSIIVIVSILLILDILGINIGPILAAAGVAGIAIGFGSQKLIEDFITGIIILLTDQIRVGDVIQIDDKGGVVEKISLNMVVLRDLSGNVHFIRNGKINIVTNMTKDFSYALFNIGVAYKEDVENVMNVIKEIDFELRKDSYFAESILDEIEVLGLDKFDDSAVIIKARIKTMPIKQWEIGRAFNLKLKKKFDELGIEIPFPHRTLYFANAEQTDKV